MKSMVLQLPIKKQLIWLFFMVMSFYLFSFYLLSSYTAGDQIFYGKFYAAVAGLDFGTAYFTARTAIGASEPVSIFLLWLGAYAGFEKNLYISAYNALLLFLIFTIARKYSAGVLVFLLLLVNYYVLVLLTGAERLKFGYIFLILAFLTQGRFRVIFLGLSVFAHFQMMLLIPSILIAYYYSSLGAVVLSFRMKKNTLYVVLATAGIVAPNLFRFYDAISDKLLFYFTAGVELSSFYGLFLLAGVALLSTRNWKRMLVCLLPFLIYISAIGEERVNMIAVTFALGLLLLENRISRPLPTMLLAYFAFKSIGFVQRIAMHGHGFA